MPKKLLSNTRGSTRVVKNKVGGKKVIFVKPHQNKLGAWAKKK